MAQSLKIKKNGIDISGKGIKSSEEVLQNCIPDLSVNLLSNTIILGQGLPNRFSSNTPSGRKEVLEKLFRADFMIEDIKQRVSNRLDELKQEKRQIEDEKLTIFTSSMIYETAMSNAEEELNSLQDIDVDKLNAEITSLSEQLNTINTQNREIYSKNEKTNGDILSLTEEKAKLSNSTYLNDELEQLFNEGNSVKNEVAILDKEIKNKESIKDICPTCGQKLIGVEKPDTTEDKKKLNELNTRLEELRKQYRNLQIKRQEEIDKQTKEYQDKIDKLKASLLSITDTTQLENELKQLQEEANNHAILISKRSELEKTIENAGKEIESLNQKLKSIENDELIVDKRIEIEKKIDSTIKRDFRGYLLSNIIALLDKTLKDYSLQVFGHKNIGLALNGNNIDITFNNKQYESLSGGEGRKLDILIFLALKNIISKYNNFYSNLFILDECLDYLDNKGTEEILNLVNNVNNVPSMFIISHRPDLQIPVDYNIQVVKDKGGSKII